MSSYINKPKKNKSESTANSIILNQNNKKAAFQYVDNRPESIVQQKMVTANQVSQLKEKKKSSPSQSVYQLAWGCDGCGWGNSEDSHQCEKCAKPKSAAAVGGIRTIDEHAPGPPAAAAAAPAAAAPMHFPSAEELERDRQKWKKESVKKARARGSGAAGASEAEVTLTKAEIATVTARAKANSDRLSGHGRQAHGGYASGSSSATLARDRERSRQAAVERALADALRRKKNGDKV